jgi:hypothetical protein
MFDEAEAAGRLRPGQADALWTFLAVRDAQTPSFRPAHILYYLGGLIAIGAMTLFMTLGWERFGATGLLLISLVYGAVAVAATESLLRRRQLALPAGIAGALAVAMVPLAAYAAQHLFGLWPPDAADGAGYRQYHTRIDARWVFMEFATLAAAALALWRYRMPFMVMPLAVTLWYMSMDVVPLLFGADPGYFFSERAKFVSVGFGIVMTLLAFAIDLRSRGPRDMAFWLYLFGVATFWGGLTALDSQDELGRLLYAVVNLLMIAIGAALARRVFAVFGGLGVALYLGHLSHTVFRDSLLFPVALTGIGLLVVAAGIAWQRHEARWGARLRGLLSPPLRALLERRAV